MSCLIKKKDNKGFTIAELLIVVAILAVLVGVAIPVYSIQLEKSKESTDAANIHAKYELVLSEVMSGNYHDNPELYSVRLLQETDDWEFFSESQFPFVNVNSPIAGGLAILRYDDSTQTVLVEYLS